MSKFVQILRSLTAGVVLCLWYFCVDVHRKQKHHITTQRNTAQHSATQCTTVHHSAKTETEKQEKHRKWTGLDWTGLDWMSLCVYEVVVIDNNNCSFSRGRSSPTSSFFDQFFKRQDFKTVGKLIVFQIFSKPLSTCHLPTPDVDQNVWRYFRNRLTQYFVKGRNLLVPSFLFPSLRTIRYLRLSPILHSCSLTSFVLVSDL